jgi:hypothetical protein
MNRLLLYIALIFGLTVSCVDSFPAPSPEDEDRRIEVFNFNTDKNSFSAEWISCEIQDFYLNPQAKVDSIVFEAGLRSQFDEEQCIARLYNYDEDKAVIGSQVESIVGYIQHTVSSGDIQYTFPRGNVRLGAQFRSTREGHFVGLTTLRIIVFYSND